MPCVSSRRIDESEGLISGLSVTKEDITGAAKKVVITQVLKVFFGAMWELFLQLGLAN